MPISLDPKFERLQDPRVEESVKKNVTDHVPWFAPKPIAHGVLAGLLLLAVGALLGWIFAGKAEVDRRAAPAQRHYERVPIEKPIFRIVSNPDSR